METPPGQRVSGPGQPASRRSPGSCSISICPWLSLPSQDAEGMFISRSLSKQTGDLAISQVRKEPSKYKRTDCKHVFIADVYPNERLATGLLLGTLTRASNTGACCCNRMTRISKPCLTGLDLGGGTFSIQSSVRRNQWSHDWTKPNQPAAASDVSVCLHVHARPAGGGAEPSALQPAVAVPC